MSTAVCSGSNTRGVGTPPYELRYKSGAASYLDLLDAQRSLFQAQQLAVQANLQRLQNQVTLYRVLGGGWSEAASPAQAAR